MHPSIKRRRPKKPQVTRAQLHQLVGQAVCDFLLREPYKSHFPDDAAQSLIEDVLEILAEQPYY